MKSYIIALLALCVAFTPIVIAQDLPKATKHPNPKFYTAYHIKFKPGKVDEGRKVITDFFEVAGNNAKNGAIAFNPQTGDWHHVVYFPWTSPADIEWKISPMGERWWSELAKVAGGPDKARALMARWQELVETEKFDIVLRSF
jgi:hypothetical protein